MTRRERLEAKLEKRREWAAGREEKAEKSFNRAHSLAQEIPFGQPILVGHHSEKRHRRAVSRIESAGFAGVEHSKMADHHKDKASGLENQLDDSIFSDDADAIPALRARIAENEAKRDRMKLVNKLHKKKDAAGLAALGIDLETLTTKLREAGSYWGSRPHLPYELTNLGARIRSDQKRIAQIEYRQRKTQRAEEAGGVLISTQGDYASVTFSEKPERDILNTLKGAGFHWGGGSWNGKADAIPECVQALSSTL